MKKGRYLVVGDIHGNMKALKQVLERCDFDREVDILIGIGDYTDGKSQSAEVVEYLCHIPNWIGIRGNHDVWCQDWLRSGNRMQIWVMQGGKATIESYLANPDYMIGDGLARHQKFFRGLHNYYFLTLDGKNYGFAHGGWTSKKGLGYEDYQSDYYWDRKLWDYSTGSNHLYQETRMKGLDYAFVGHTATNYMFPDLSPPITSRDGRLINVDQGAGWNGKLTICDVKTLDCWQSDTVEELYGKIAR